ncbi:MAG: exonuclease SbcCD subunit D [Armatimonadetes bacterium]|nr:exonuclease SbcCD subunit D [Armatimonadota bacterium]
MRIAHMADAHLGYRAYNRVNKFGLNAREVDVLDAFRQALVKVAEIDAKMLLIAGDLFHAVRPSNLAIQYAYRELLALRNRTEAPVVIIGGNHDSPRSSDTGCILDLLTNVEGVHVVHAEPKSLRFAELDTTVFCLPHAALPLMSTIRATPDPESKYNILMAHARPEGSKKGFDQYEITRDDIRHEEWDYVAYGHLHSFEQLAPNAYHPGSLEYAGGLSVWDQFEESKDKGFIEYDLDERSLVQFHTVQTREIVDIRLIDADGMSPPDLNMKIRKRIDGVRGGVANKIVRLVIENVDREMRAEIDYSALRQVRADALHFDLDLRRPQSDGHYTRDAAGVAARPLEVEWETHVKLLALPPGVDRDRIRDTGFYYLARTANAEDL